MDLPFGEKTAEVGGGTEPSGCFPFWLYWFVPGEGCRGRHEEAAALTPLPAGRYGEDECDIK